jgi:hypothetical protein
MKPTEACLDVRVSLRIGKGCGLNWMARLSAIIPLAFLLGGCTAAPRPGAEANVPARVSAPPHQTLSGAELYAVHCNRCHPERYGPERTEAHWTTILLHMRTRANLPAEQARTILKYLQEGSGS